MAVWSCGGRGRRVARAGGRARRRAGRSARRRARRPAAAGRRAGGDHAGARGPAVVIATSGSTGEPKLVGCRPRRCGPRREPPRHGWAGPGRWLLALPAEHVAGVQVIVRSLLAGAAPGVQDLRDGLPARRLRRRHRRAGRGTPLHQPGADPARCGCSTPAAPGLGGAARLRRRARRRGRPRRRAARPGARGRAFAVVTTYGMSETAGGCVYDGVPLDGVRCARRRRPDPARRADAGGGLPRATRGRPRRRSPTAGSAPATSAGGATGGWRCSAGPTT